MEKKWTVRNKAPNGEVLAIECGNYIIGKFMTPAPVYGLWKDKERIGFFNTAEEAKEKANV